jgi:2-polyprenyl-3-methyl-5-hydroxy-6-metoxy-1,4-benzoquinol methylase
MGTREKNRDDREYDTTQLHESGHGKTLHRDYSAHFWRWSFARRFITAKDNVLEVGCGEDRPLSKILTGGAAPHVNTYVGVDLNKLKTSASQRLAFHGEFNFVEEYKKLLKQPLPNGKSVGEGFDVVVHYEVIEHMKVQNGAAMLRACFASLRPGGTMLMSTPCYDGKRHAANHIHEYTVPELQKSTEKAGFKVVRRFGTFMDIKHIKKAKPTAGADKQGELFGTDGLSAAVPVVAEALAQYFDSDAISNIFGPLFPDHARNNLWVCRKEK